ncbi:MAG: hypothetical protein ACRDDY_19530, partial [Clostridium sp.]|uniref:hypothetical protein n=1 Tax=Clostridium sp. TaxID=1506 RepID=UPI003EE6FE61
KIAPMPAGAIFFNKLKGEKMSNKYGKQKWCRVLNNNNRTNCSKVLKYTDMDYALELKTKINKFINKNKFNNKK